MIDWSKHTPHKEAPLTGQMTVHCECAVKHDIGGGEKCAGRCCGWKSQNNGKWAMDQYRAHVSALLPKREEIKTATLDKKVSAKHSTRRRWK